MKIVEIDMKTMIKTTFFYLGMIILINNYSSKQTTKSQPVLIKESVKNVKNNKVINNIWFRNRLLSYTRYYYNRNKKIIKLFGNAKNFVHKKYVFGGFDCSKFTQDMYASQGIKLPRTAKEQSKTGKFVKRDNLMPGDLILFKNTYRVGVSHTGIYLGYGKFIHNSSGKKRVCVSSLKNTYYNKHYHSGRRIIDGV